MTINNFVSLMPKKQRHSLITSGVTVRKSLSFLRLNTVDPKCRNITGPFGNYCSQSRRRDVTQSRWQAISGFIKVRHCCWHRQQTHNPAVSFWIYQNWCRYDLQVVYREYFTRSTAPCLCRLVLLYNRSGGQFEGAAGGTQAANCWPDFQICYIWSLDEGIYRHSYCIPALMNTNDGPAPPPKKNV